MNHKYWKIACIASSLLCLAIAIRFAVLALPLRNAPELSIIGGADAPTANFMKETITSAILRSPLFIIALVSLTVFVISLVVLLIKRFRKQ